MSGDNNQGRAFQEVWGSPKRGPGSRGRGRRGGRSRGSPGHQGFHSQGSHDFQGIQGQWYQPPPSGYQVMSGQGYQPSPPGSQGVHSQGYQHLPVQTFQGYQQPPPGIQGVPNQSFQAQHFPGLPSQALPAYPGLVYQPQQGSQGVQEHGGRVPRGPARKKPRMHVVPEVESKTLWNNAGREVIHDLYNATPGATRLQQRNFVTQVPSAQPDSSVYVARAEGVEGVTAALEAIDKNEGRKRTWNVYFHAVEDTVRGGEQSSLSATTAPLEHPFQRGRASLPGPQVTDVTDERDQGITESPSIDPNQPLRSARAEKSVKKEGNAMEGIKRPTPGQAQTCANCGGDHTLKQCVTPNQHGLVLGCPKCNLGTHTIQTCPLIKGEAELAMWAANSRGLKPPLSTTTPWFRLVRAAWRDPDYRKPTLFPWTTGFAKRTLTEPALIAQVSAYYESFDINQLPVDPATADKKAVNATFSTNISKKLPVPKTFESLNPPVAVKDVEEA